MRSWKIHHGDFRKSSHPKPGQSIGNKIAVQKPILLSRAVPQTVISLPISIQPVSSICFHLQLIFFWFPIISVQ